MKQTIGAFLKLIETYCDAANEQQEVVAFCADKKEQYILEVEKRCAEYKEKYMDAEVKYLDRHKIAAILVVVGLKVGIVKMFTKTVIHLKYYLSGHTRYSLWERLNT